MYNSKYGFAPYFYTKTRRIYSVWYLSISDTENTVRRYASPPPVCYGVYTVPYVTDWALSHQNWFWNGYHQRNFQTIYYRYITPPVERCCPQERKAMVFLIGCSRFRTGDLGLQLHQIVKWEMGKTDLNPQGVRMASQLFNDGLIKEYWQPRNLSICTFLIDSLGWIFSDCRKVLTCASTDAWYIWLYLI